MCKIRRVAFVSLVFGILSFVQGRAEGALRIHLSTPKKALVTYEPLTLQIEYHHPDIEKVEPKLLLKINGKTVREQGTLFPRKFRRSQNDTSVLMVELFYDGREKKHFFDRAGSYTLFVKDQEKGIESNPLEIHVRAPTEREKEALALFVGSEDRLVTFLTENTQGDAEADFETICTTYPDTVYAAYVSCSLGLKKLRELQQNPVKRKDEGFKKALPYFKRAVGRVPGSKLEETALFHLAWCQGLSKDYDNCKKNLYLLKKKFPYGSFTSKVDAMLKELVDHGV